MTRSDVMASSRPRTRGGMLRTGARRRAPHRLWVLPAILLLAAMLLPSSAIAAEEPTSGYTQTPTTAKTTPSSGTSPSKETKTATTPTTEAAPVTTSTTPKASTLPFTGFDLRWDIGFGVVLLGAGISILAMQRRQRRRSER